MPKEYSMNCCIKACKSNNNMDGMKFHTFPADPYIKEQWKRVVNQPGFEPKKRSLMCMLHFPPSEYRGSRLKKGAIPTLPVLTASKEHVKSLGNLHVFSLSRFPHLQVSTK